MSVRLASSQFAASLFAALVFTVVLANAATSLVSVA